jgi:hypothetical protein
MASRPDHPKLKQPAVVFDKIAQSPGFTYFGNVTVGREVGIDELRSTHHAVVIACGAETDRRMGIAGRRPVRQSRGDGFRGLVQRPSRSP